MPPWQVEDEASQLWWERWRTWREESRQAQPKRGKGGSLGSTDIGIESDAGL